MAAPIIQIRPSEDIDRQIDAYIINRMEYLFENFFKHDDPLTAEQACEVLNNCSIGTLNKYVRKGLKRYKDGQKVYYLRQDLIKYIQSLPSE